MSIGSIALSLFRTGVTAHVDMQAKSLQAATSILEDKSKPKGELAKQFIFDESFEVLSKTFGGSLFVKLMRSVAPVLPEQISNFVGEMIGAGLHWKASSHQSKNDEVARESGHAEEPGMLGKFFDNCIKAPFDFLFKHTGLSDDPNKTSFLKFGLSQLGIVGASFLVLKGAEGENIPGMNMNKSDSKLTTFFKITGYTIFEQIAHLSSQTMRYYKDYKKEFNNEKRTATILGFNKDILAKTIANVFHERAFPGNILSAIGGCLSTLWLGDKLSKPIAGALGEIIPKGLERFLTVHLRRSTKHRTDDKGNKVDNYRLHDKAWFRNIIDTTDAVLNPLRRMLVTVTAKILKPSNVSTENYVKELESTYDMDHGWLKQQHKHEQELKAQHEQQTIPVISAPVVKHVGAPRELVATQPAPA